jgi:hypothetical protein
MGSMRKAIGARNKQKHQEANRSAEILRHVAAAIEEDRDWFEQNGLELDIDLSEGVIAVQEPNKTTLDGDDTSFTCRGLWLSQRKVRTSY